ncbi:proline/glycine betaine ABC transporter permease [Paenibacillus sp. J5C_2022]|uniref:ABC transporter permease n=1 Tax=Paenibacillus sp. J5C2022 TaxID=2977129 RepID=UPI0021CFB8E8|nr:proline/glycine betaine ABC transporter permease [Paenibacillus sp. J5C2022]MCU6711987.1 proline/glycine betaine ABC transporter permease [Paenibacillus sp. J5C2022]
MNLPKIPLADWVEATEDWLEDNLEPVFDFIGVIIKGIVEGLNWLLDAPHPFVIIALFTALAWYLGKWRLGVFTAVGLLLVENLELWEPTMQTLSLVITAAFISIVLGIPIGILCARSNKMQKIVTPILDFMQTMPAFVYLLPVIVFFGLGVVPGVISSIVFAIPPTIRLTNLGIRQVPEELVEAADAFGSTPGQKLVKLQLPIAMPTIMAGVNQTIMLSLSMVVIASMVGAQGTGSIVLRAITQLKTGIGFEAGLAIVIIAIILDRMTQQITKRSKAQ